MSSSSAAKSIPPERTAPPAPAAEHGAQPASVQPLRPVDVPAPTGKPAAKKPSGLKRLIQGALLVAVLGAAAYYGHSYWTVGRFMVSTDDAYVKADMSVVGAKIAGYVKSVPFADNVPVKAGDVILTLDDGDYQLAVKAAEAKLETQNATLATIAQQRKAQEAALRSAEAQLSAAQAALLNATQTQQRASQLVKRSFGSQQALDDATRIRATADANLSSAQANIDAANAQLAILDAQGVTAQKQTAELQIAVEKAKRDLGFAEIRAPFDGIVANRAVEPGQFVAAGTRLLAVVPVQQSFITANFKETQIPQIHPGQKAEIEVDAFKGETFEGHVDSIAPASGAEFSLLPPENATGNFTKITQRIPVKVTLPPELSRRLRPGYSVSVSVDLRDTGSATTATP